MPSIDNVEDVTPRVQYTAAAAQTDFDYPFPIFQDADLVVDVDGVTKALSTNYDVSGEGEDTGGTVTFLVAMTGGEIVTIYRDIAIERTSDFQQNGPWSSQTTNDEFDRITLILQQQESRIGRAMRMDVTDDGGDEDQILPAKADRAGTYLAFDADGKPTTSAGTGNDTALRTDLADTSDSLGDTLIAVKYANIDAVPLNLHSWIEDDQAYNVMGFIPQNLKSAIRNFTSTTDLDSYLQNAIDAAYSETNGILLPRGRFNVNAGLSLTFSGTRLTQGLHIRGASRNATVLRQTGAPTELLKFNGGNGSIQLVLEHLTLQGVTALPTAYGVTLKNAADIVLRDLTVEGFTRGINIEASLQILLDNLQVSNSPVGIMTRLNGGSRSCNAITARRVNAVGCSTFGFDIGDANLFSIENCDIETCGTAANTATGGVMVRNTCDNESGIAEIHISRTWMESNFGRGVQVESGMSELIFSFTKSHIVSQESGRAMVIGGARKLAIEDSTSPSTNDTWDLTSDQAFIKNSVVYTLTDTGVTYPTYINVSTNAVTHVYGREETWTGTLAGYAAGPTGTVRSIMQGRMVNHIFASDILGTSNANSLSMTGMPARFRPAATVSVAAIVEDNGVDDAVQAAIASSGTVTFTWRGSTFTASGSKGIRAGAWPPYRVA